MRLASHFVWRAIRDSCFVIHLAAASLLAMTAAGGELKVSVQSFPDGGTIRPGTAIVLAVEGLEPGQTATWHRVRTAGETAIWVLSITSIDGKPAPPPADALSVLVAKLAEGLDGKQAVAKMFADAIPRIESEELWGSQAIVEAVSKPIAALDSAAWQKFSRLLYEHLMATEKAGLSQEQWAVAYRSVVTGLGGVK